ncbi:TMEM165/GDT1 family protein [Parasphingopyxis sp.]|uniref:TMEM165/GDT1 family protein n=1 Tax=Parasphingopyxis sp. TaxID=1920299 RepID=UPI00261945C3|nr:TMEM165/GDT1 family protein [Parasphingopyxis sp.]
MDIFFLPLLAAALAEWGDKTQILAMLLAARFARPIPVFIGVGAAIIVHMSLAAFGGSLLTAMITPDAIQLFLGLGFLFAGVAAFLPFSDPDADGYWNLGAVLTSFFAFLTVEFGDKTQFITAGFGGTSPSWHFTAAGASLGVMIGIAPAILLGTALRETLPLTLIRRTIGALFLFISSIIAINVFALI